MKKPKREFCKCKIPEPRMKNSENGIYSYCKICKKEYKINFQPTQPSKT